MSDQPLTPDYGLPLRRVAALIEQTTGIDYDPSQMDGVWVCGDHGMPECEQGACADLQWPEPNADAILGGFMDWADGEFRRVVAPYDAGSVPEMPDEAFRSYSIGEWPVADLIARTIPSAECDGCLCPTEHDGDYGSSGHPGPCPPHTCGLPPGSDQGADRG